MVDCSDLINLVLFFCSRSFCYYQFRPALQIDI